VGPWCRVTGVLGLGLMEWRKGQTVFTTLTSFSLPLSSRAQGTPVGAAAAGSMGFLAIPAVRTATETEMASPHADPASCL
jgi:hypothetical protein